MSFASNYPLNVVTPTDSESGGPVSVSSGVGAGTKGSYVALINSTSKKSKQVVVTLSKDVATNVEGTFDIATGDPTQVDKVKNEPFSLGGNTAGSYGASIYSFPFEIPAGSKVWIRLEDDNVSALAYTAGIGLKT